jgi:hypothetical protein
MGYPYSEDLKTGLGWAEVHLDVQLSREIPVGAALVVTSKVVKIGKAKVRRKSFSRLA